MDGCTSFFYEPSTSQVARYTRAQRKNDGGTGTFEFMGYINWKCLVPGQGTDQFGEKPRGRKKKENFNANAMLSSVHKQMQRIERNG
jgi:hypothetical protein